MGQKGNKKLEWAHLCLEIVDPFMDSALTALICPRLCHSQLTDVKVIFFLSKKFVQDLLSSCAGHFSSCFFCRKRVSMFQIFLSVIDPYSHRNVCFLLTWLSLFYLASCFNDLHCGLDLWATRILHIVMLCFVPRYFADLSFCPRPYP